MKQYLSIDIGGSAIKWGIVNENYEVLSHNSFPVPDDFDKLVNEINNLIVKNNLEIEGIGVASPGGVNPETGDGFGISAIPYIPSRNLKKEIHKKTTYSVAIANDANCAALAEDKVGAAKGTSSSCFIVIGSGVGGAIIIKGNIIIGKNYHSGEFGYMIGKNGKMYSENCSTRSLEDNVFKNHNIKLDGEKIFQNSELYEKEITNLFEYLAQLVVQLQYSIDPEVFVFSGAITMQEKFIDLLQKEIDKIFKDYEEKGHTIKINIKKATHSKDANIIGAIVNYKKEYEN